jgi:hypothetical protein
LTIGTVTVVKRRDYEATSAELASGGFSFAGNCPIITDFTPVDLAHLVVPLPMITIWSACLCWSSPLFASGAHPLRVLMARWFDPVVVLG